MTHQNYTIYGQVSDSSAMGIAALTVRIDTTDPNFPRLDPTQYSATTDDQGEYVIDIGTSGLDAMFTDHDGVLHTTGDIGVAFTITRADGRVLGHLSRTVTYDDICFGEQQSFIVTVPDDVVCCPPPPDCLSYRAFGTVYDEFGEPAPGVTVVLVQKQFQGGTDIADGLTDEKGDYAIEYLIGESCHSDGPQTALYVDARESLDPGASVLGKSRLVVRAKVRQRFDVHTSELPGQRSEYARLIAELSRAMEGTDPESLGSAGWQPDDVAFLTNRVGFDETRVARVITAIGLHGEWQAQTLPPAYDSSVITPQVLYAWLNSTKADSLQQLARHPEYELARALASAIENHRIDPIPLADESLAMETYSAIARTLIDTEGWQTIDAATSKLGKILGLGAFSGTADEQAASKRAFIAAYRARETTVDEFFAGYADPLLDAALLQVQVRLASIVGPDFELLEHLLAGMSPPTLSAVRMLARLHEDGWLAELAGLTLPARVPGGDEPTRRNNYALGLRRAFEYAYPEVAIMEGLVDGLDCQASDPCPPERLIAGVCPCTLRQIVEDEPNFRLRSTNIASELSHLGSSVPNPLPALQLVQRLYAVMPDTESAGKIRALLDAGIESAAQITRIGQGAYVRRFAGLLGDEDRARLSYARAEHITSAVTQLVTAASSSAAPELVGVPPRTLYEAGNELPAAPNTPDLQQLFGSFDHCHCRHCNSILGPAAYLTDLLEYLGEDGRATLGCDCPPDPTDTSRRPDICAIELNCANALTPLPHIDLVLELLEERALWLNELASDFPLARATTRDAEALRVHPEYSSVQAYAALREPTARGTGTPAHPYAAAIAPWHLPFDLPLEEARGYLEQLGTSVAQLVELLQPETEQRKDRLAREALAIAPTVHALLFDDEVPNASTLTLQQRPATMAWLGDPAGANYLPDLLQFRNARPFMAATGLELREVLALFQTQWAGRLDDTQSKVALEHAENAPCDLSSAFFTSSTDDELEGDEHWNTRLQHCHRFVRLWKHTGVELSCDELDEAMQKLVTVSGPVDLTPDFLEKLGDFERVRAKFPKIDVMTLLTWWGDIEARPDKLDFSDTTPTPHETLFQRLFARALEDSPPLLRPYFDLELDTDGSFELAGASFPLPLYEPGADNPLLPIVATAFGTTHSELVDIITHVELEPTTPGSSPTLTLRNLSVLYLRVTLARALGLTFNELSVWEDLLEVPLSSIIAASVYPTGRALEFIEAYEKMSSVFSSEALGFILRGEAARGSDLGLDTAASYRMVLAALIKVVEYDTEQPASILDVEGGVTPLDKLRIVLERLPPRPQVLAHVLDIEKLLIIAAGDESVTLPGFAGEADWRTYVDVSLDGYHRPFFRRDGVDDHAPSLYDDVLEFDLGAAPADLAERSLLRCERLYRQLRHYEALAALEPILAESIVGSLGLELDACRALLRTLEPRSAVVLFLHRQVELAVGPELGELGDLSAITDDAQLTAAVATARPELTTLLDELHATSLRLQRAALLINSLTMSADMVDWLGTSPRVDPDDPSSHALRLDLLAPTRIELETYSVTEMARLLAFVDATRTGFAREADCLDLLSTSFLPAKTDTTQVDEDDVEFISTSGEVPLEDVTALIGPAGLRPMSYGDLRDFVALSRIFVAAEIATRTGTSIEQLGTWVAQELDSSAARRIKARVEARYDDRTRADVLGPLRDRLRLRQRDALVAYIDQYLDYPRATHDLFGWLLLDPYVEACSPTSRIKAATTSIQQLVGRLHLDLEPGWGPNPTILEADAREQWAWRKHYRVWEAQRKVYLYPENWLDPQLRDDQSELFQAFARSLRSNDVDEESVESALSEYLRGLNDIARLEVNGVHHEVERSKSGRVLRDVLHVFARSRGRSGVNYHRTREMHGNAGWWTPWTQLPFEIDAKDVLPIVHNRRLKLFWLQFEARTGTKKADPNDTEPNEIHYRVSLNWSELQFGQWSAPKSSEDQLLALTFDIPELAQSLRTESPRDAIDFIEILLPFLRPSGRVHTPIHSDYIRMEHHVAHDGDLHVHVSFSLPHQSNGTTYLAGFFEFSGCDQTAHAVLEHRTGLRPLPFARCMPKASFERGQGFFTSKPTHAVHLSDQRDSIITKKAGSARDHEIINARPHYPRDEMPWENSFYQDERYSLFFHYTPEKLRAAPGDDYGLSSATSASPIDDIDVQFPNEIPDDDDGTPDWDDASGGDELDPDPRLDYEISVFYHPYACFLSDQLDRLGPAGIYRPNANHSATEHLVRQRNRELVVEVECQPNGAPFHFEYCPPAQPLPAPTSQLRDVYQTFDFNPGSAYGIYNWELFYHIPLFIARELAAQRDFEAALRWLNYIFDPSEREIGLDKVDYWRFGGFKDRSRSLQELLQALADGSGDDEVAQLEAAILFAQREPFNPHAVARLRGVPYQIAVVLTYVQTLLDWGDQLFGQGTNETIVEATQLYLLADSLLGRRPVELPATQSRERDYCSLSFMGLDVTGNSLVDVENHIVNLVSAGRTPFSVIRHARPRSLVRPPRPTTYGKPLDEFATSPVVLDGIGPRSFTGLSETGLERRPAGPPIRYYTGDQDGEKVLYYCVPHNDRLERYWDTVQDRLNKVRNCLDLAGQPRAFSLFAAPIDPGALVAALAGAGDLATALDELEAPPPIYRFQTQLGMAESLAKEVESLGSQLYAALEKADAQHLAELRAHQEVAVLDRVDFVLEARVSEANAQLSSLDAQLQATRSRIQFYDGREARNARERQQLGLMSAAASLQLAAAGMTNAAAHLNFVPSLLGGGEGAPGSPVVTTRFGGDNLRSGLAGFASAIAGAAAADSTNARRSGYAAQLERRDEDWNHMRVQAKLDEGRIESEIASATARRDAARGELERHRLQRQQSEEVRDFMHQRFTNEELFTWLARELSLVFYRCQQIASEFAKRALRCFEIELDESPVRRPDFATWDRGRKGLLSGERLTSELRQLEADFHDQHERHREIRQSFSLRELDATALEALKSTGECRFRVPESAFDVHHAGHYLRKIKRVRVSIPCTKPRMASVDAKVSLERSWVRRVAQLDAEPILDAVGGTRHIALSDGMADSGVFDGSFGSPRYLPFENYGVISEWRIRLPRLRRNFDYAAIDDVVFDIEYMARDGGDAFRMAVLGALQAKLDAELDVAPFPLGSSPQTSFVTVVTVRHLDPARWTAWKSGLQSNLPVDDLRRRAQMEHAASVKVYPAVLESVTDDPVFDPVPSVGIDGNVVATQLEAKLEPETRLWAAGAPLAGSALGPSHLVTLEFAGSAPTRAQRSRIVDIVLFLHYAPSIGA